MKTTIFDTTLRDGAQSVSVAFTIADKLKILDLLDNFGIEFAECGSPGISLRDAELFEKLMDKKYANIHPVAFAPTCAPGKAACDDASLVKAVELCGEHLSICGKSSLTHTLKVLGVSEETNLRMIWDSVLYAKKHGKKVFFDAEHFFDGYREDRIYSISTLKAALDAGADYIILCDTNGAMMPQEISQITAAVKKKLGCVLGIHCHNDSGLAVANTIEALRAGADILQGAVCGIGERCGNTDLCTLIPDLQFKMGYSLFTPAQMKTLTGTARGIADIANIVFNERTPYVGSYSFSHKAGMHIDGEIKLSNAFEHITPEDVGNFRSVLMSEQSGRAAAYEKIRHFIPDAEKNSKCVDMLLEKVKNAELSGYQYENADGSLALLILELLGKRRPFFKLLDFQIVLSDPTKPNVGTKALIKIDVDGESALIAAEGDGPVNAMDKALRKSLERFYPSLSEVKLTDYKVRVINSDAATAAKVRVNIETSDITSSWRTVGVSTDIIEASWIALCDSIEYKLSNDNHLL